MWVRATSFALLLPFLTVISTAQRIGSSNETYAVRGRVVNSVTGEPIPRALVQMSSDRQHSALTGGDGTFEFANLPAGATININVQKPGYFSEASIRSPRTQVTWIRVGPDQPAAVVKLTPEAVISGHVAGDSGEPVESLPVQVFADRIENGKKTRTAIGSTMTNDLGEYRVPELPPGKYFVFAGPSSWPVSFAALPRARARARGQGISATVPQGARGYPGMFYPAASDMTSASEIEVHAGQHVEINFNVASQPFHRISGTVSGYPDDAQGLNLQATNAAGQPVGVGFQFDQQRGTFRSQWMPTGKYNLMASTQDPDGQSYFASRELDLGADITGLQLSLSPGAIIPITYREEKTRNESGDMAPMVETRQTRRGMVRVARYAPVNVILIADEPSKSQQQFNARLAEGKGSMLELVGVPPGVYSAQIYPNSGNSYVASARSGGVNLLEQKLTVEAGATVPPIEIVLRDDYGSLAGTLRFPDGTDSALLVVVPEGGTQPIRNQEVMRGPGPYGREERNSSFQLPPLPPGTYRVLALDRVEGFEYSNPDVLEKYLAEAREIRVAPNQRAEIELEVVHVGEQP